MSRIREKERRAILDSLRAGVVPRVGQQHIQVGRAAEVQALLKDIDTIADEGSAIRFIIGEYGSGKTFFLNLIHSIALERKLVSTCADLTPDRRLHATGGQARALYAELMRNISTRAKPDGGALASIAERFISQSLQQARETGSSPGSTIHERLAQLTEMTGGYDFALVLEAYWQGHDSGNEQLKGDAVRWMRAEFSTKTDARKALGVRTIIDDANCYDHLKLMARFVRLAGYNGLLVALDELVNLFKLSSSQARKSNYEQILRILNDTLQGSAEGLGFLMGGTPEFLMDPRRGLYSYEALQTRLAENRFARDGLVDYSGPVIRLANLSQEDLYILLQKIRHVMAAGDASAYLVPEEALTAFLDHCHERIGAAYFKTPRNSIKEFVALLSVLEQNPGQDWRELIGQVEVESDGPEEIEALDDEAGDDSEQEQLHGFQL
ncbi:ATP-binding protein [Spectribacter hydrogenoxidans]|uniref:ATP-binding protein n=1 Tax=Spectribacter hydrogenoxidans TaxID=3075608 RepID=A0ABU3BXS0_9GAMM|nr:ATP-binding protein [Salinisphaera sp. W335]MDT0634111.1 ATP-binding protein [Salinisphaera sp. W335]